MQIKETALCDRAASELIALSADWEAENSCYGYRKNEYGSLEGNRIFIAEENGEIIAYLFGHLRKSKNQGAVVPDGTDYFEVQELYVKPEWRSRGVGSALFRYAETQVRPEAEYLMLGTATKNFRAILHFYIDELGMEFWSARLLRSCKCAGFEDRIMYERLLNKQIVPTSEELAAYCGGNGALFQKLNEQLFQLYGTTQEIRFPYGNHYGWSAAHRKKKKLICDVFAEAGAFTVMLRLSNQQFDSVYGELQAYTQNYIDNKYPCGEGGWIHYRVLNEENFDDIMRLLAVKCG